MVRIRHTLLSAPEERALAVRIRAGDAAARDELVEHNLALVVSVARRFEGRGLDLDDLIGEGNLGLIRAAERYDPSFGVRFTTYATNWIKQAIGDALLNRAALIRLPAYQCRALARWRRLERRMTNEGGGVVPGPEAVSARMGLTAAQHGMILRARTATSVTRNGDLTADSPAPEETAGGGEDGAGVDDEANLSAVALRAALGRIDERQRRVLSLRYGLDGEGSMTRAEVGDRLGISRDWAGKVERRAMADLKWIMGGPGR